MSIQTVDKPEDRREKIRKLREYHQPVLDAIDASDSPFIPKMAYVPYEKNEKHIGFFLSEMNKGCDVFVEFTSKELVPEDPERKLYRWRFNPHFEEEYTQTEPTPSTGNVRYLVPVEELIVVKVEDKVIVKNSSPVDFDLPDPEDDLPVDQMTIRDLAAMLLKKPVSRKEWLNKIITDK